MVSIGKALKRTHLSVGLLERQQRRVLERGLDGWVFHSTKIPRPARAWNEKFRRPRVSKRQEAQTRSRCRQRIGAQHFTHICKNRPVLQREKTWKRNRREETHSGRNGVAAPFISHSDICAVFIVYFFRVSRTSNPQYVGPMHKTPLPLKYWVAVTKNNINTWTSHTERQNANVCKEYNGKTGVAIICRCWMPISCSARRRSRWRGLPANGSTTTNTTWDTPV